MDDQRLLTVSVECYAGHRGEQTPRTLILGDRRIAVAEVVDASLAPDYRYFNREVTTAIRISFATMSNPRVGN